MIKNILVGSLLGLTLVMSGCGDTEGEERLEIQQMLDNQDYAGVISKLESSASTQDEYISLGAAYMGKAGLSLTNIITSMVTSEGDSGSTFSGFVTAVKSSSTNSALPDLKKAISNYYKVVGRECLQPETLNSSQKDICLYIGLASTSSAAVTVDLITGDISKFGDNGNSDDKLTASTCALQYGFEDRNASNVDANCSISKGSDVVFTALNKTYTDLNVTVNGETYYYLLNDLNQTVLTKDYCTATDFSTRTGSYVVSTPSYYACPINETAASEELTTAGVLVDILNDGIGAIGGAVSDDMQGDIDEFKCEIIGGSYDENSDCNKSIDANVSEEDIINYLKNQN